MITRSEKEDILKFLSKSRWKPEDITKLKALYNKWVWEKINKVGLAYPRFDCSSCVREAIEKVRLFLEKETILDEIKNNKRARSKKK